MNTETKLAELAQLETSLRAGLADVARIKRELGLASGRRKAPLPRTGPLGLIAQISIRLGATIADTIGGRRYKGSVNARFASSLVLRRLGFSFPDIAELLGYADHTSAMHACGVATGRENLSPAFRDAVAYGVIQGEIAGLERKPYNERWAALAAAARMKYPTHGEAPVNEFCKCPKCQASVAV